MSRPIITVSAFSSVLKLVIIAASIEPGFLPAHR